MPDISVTPARIGDEAVLTTTTAEVRSPFDGRVVGVVPVCDEGHIDQAVEIALERHRGTPMPAHQRAQILDDAAVLVAHRLDEFAASISAESAKPVATARVEAMRAVDTLRFSAAVARTLVGEMVPLDASTAGEGKFGFVKRVPIGVIGAISPFNFPLNLVCHKIAPALAAGCPVVLKPASATPLTALMVAALFEEAGLPPGWLNVVTCPGSVANRLVTHDDVAMITFTGSPPVGWSIRTDAPRKRVSLELGNNAPVIVTANSDWHSAVAKIAVGGYSYAGQSCISVQRVYVERSIHDDFVGELRAKVEGLRVGDPADPSTHVSSLIAESETERVTQWIDEAVASGGELLCGGKVDGQGILQPTLMSGIEPDMKVSRDEVFGPFVGLVAYDDLDDAIDWSNDTRYGLQAGIFTRDLATALDAADRLDFGGVTINEVPTWRADQQPYGGVRDSGNTREGPAYTAADMTERRMVIIQP